MLDALTTLRISRPPCIALLEEGFGRRTGLGASVPGVAAEMVMAGTGIVVEVGESEFAFLTDPTSGFWPWSE
jgi:hypothetical protein